MKSSLFSVAYMFGLTLFFTSAVSAVKYVNDERIAVNEALKLQAVVLDALAIALPEDAGQIQSTFEKRVKEIIVKDRVVYVGYGEDGSEVIGYAFDAGGPGFWGPIATMAAVDSGTGRLLGVNFYRHSETPGLGARITEEGFRRQFRGLELQGRDGIFFRLLPAGTASGPDGLDAVTGATETSRAVERFLNTELDRFLSEIAGALPGRN
jgi:Na+-transporting NADH:ubiquinone oxidoreductase subunit C